MGKLRGCVRPEGKVRAQTPKVEKMDKPKPKTGRSKKRSLCAKRTCTKINVEYNIEDYSRKQTKSRFVVGAFSYLAEYL